MTKPTKIRELLIEEVDDSKPPPNLTPQWTKEKARDYFYPDANAVSGHITMSGAVWMPMWVAQDPMWTFSGVR